MVSLWLTTFLLNAVWQITAITLLAFVSAKLLRRLPSLYAHRVWAAALGACLLIPLMTVIVQYGRPFRLQEDKPTIIVANESLTPASQGMSMPLHSMSHSIYIPAALSRTLLWAFSFLLLYKTTQLAWGVYRTYRIRQCAHEHEIPARLSAVAERCSRALCVPNIPLLCCDAVSTPATIGFWKPVVLLPGNFFTSDMSEDDFASALSHEFAHIGRGDFLLNLLYEIISLPVCFHPFAALIKSRMSHTRELACDDVAARILPSQSLYARSLLRLAESMWSQSEEPKYALGLFDTKAMEERVVNILKTKTTSSKWTRAVRLTAVCLVGAVALGISVFSLKLAAENTINLQQFAGTWECKYKGRIFFTLKMAVHDGVLGGTAIHSKRVSWVDGEIIPDTDETTNDKIFDTHASGQELTIQIADGPNDADPISINFKLVGKNESEAKLIVEKQPDAPAQKKPWHFQRVSNAQ